MDGKKEKEKHRLRDMFKFGAKAVIEALDFFIGS